MTDIKYTYFLGGQNTYMRAGIDALRSELDPVLNDTDWENSRETLESNKALHIDTRPTMDAGVVSGLVFGLCLFVGGWAGEKVLDKFYEAKLKGPLSNFLRKTFQKAHFPYSKRLEYQQLITFQDIDLTVLVRLLLNSEDEIKESLDLLLQVHKSANQWINDHGKKAPIHCYVVEDGNCNLEPKFYSSLSEIQKEERDRVIRNIKGKHKT